MAEAGIHAIPFEPGPGLERFIELLRNAVEIDAGRILIVEVERKRGVVKLRSHPAGAAEGAGALEIADDFRGQHFAGLIVPREVLQQLFIAEEFLEHLRWDFDEIAFGGEAGDAGPLRVSAKDSVHEMPELMEEGDHV